MTVAEMITKLQDMPQDADVVLHDLVMFEIDCITIESAVADRGHYPYYIEDTPYAQNAIERDGSVVRQIVVIW